MCDVFTASENNIKEEEEIKKEKGGQDFVNLVVLFLSRGRRGNLFVSCDVYKGPDNPPRRNEKEWEGATRSSGGRGTNTRNPGEKEMKVKKPKNPANSRSVITAAV